MIDKDAWWQFEFQEGRLDRGSNAAEGVVGSGRLNYHRYLRLDLLLAAQEPRSTVPAERGFILTHQIFELVFADVLFDFATISRFLRWLRDLESEERFREVALAGEGREMPLWTPALDASARALHGIASVIPVVLTYVDPRGPSPLLTRGEFLGFRDWLKPASGFQSSQFRELQVALGKRRLVQDLLVFPTAEFADEVPPTRGQPPRISVVSDSVVLGGASVSGSRDVDVDEAIHGVLLRLGRGKDPSTPVPLLSRESGLDRVRRQFASAWRPRGEGDTGYSMEERAAAAAAFRASLDALVLAEDDARVGLGAARRAAEDLPPGNLHKVVSRFVQVDMFLVRFLEEHLRVAAAQIGSARGSAGGGAPYLQLMIDAMKLFPAVVACAGMPTFHESMSNRQP